MRWLLYSKIGFVVIAFAFAHLCSCSNDEFQDYTQTKNGLYYKLVDIGDSDSKAVPGDYITAQMTIQAENDSILYNTQRIGLEGTVTFILESPQHPKDYREGFQLLSEGDSAQLVTDAYTFYMKKNKAPIPKGMNLQSLIKIFVRIIKIETTAKHKQWLEKEKQFLDKGEMEEKKKIEHYLNENNIQADTFANGIYYIRQDQGAGPTMTDSNRLALINYQGTFLNGRVFDFLYENQPFEYLIGSEDQLIKGLEIGIRRMSEGEKGKFIIPSHLAYGSSGSSSGIVPPFTTVIYEVELLKVQ